MFEFVLSLCFEFAFVWGLGLVFICAYTCVYVCMCVCVCVGGCIVQFVLCMPSDLSQHLCY